MRRSNTFPIPGAANASKQPQQSMAQIAGCRIDERQAVPVQHPNQSPSVVPQPSPAVLSMADRESAQLSTPSSPLSQQQQSTPLKHSISFSPLFDNPSRLPDLMPMMFPSDDPFAYPNQPMSTLEDSQFKQEPTDMTRHFPYRSNHALSAALESGNQSQTTVSSPGGFINTPNYSTYSNQDFTTLANLTSRPKNINRFSAHQHERRLSESTPDSIGSGSGTAGYMENPDLVTMPSQAFLWQSLAAQGSSGHPFHQHSAPEEIFRSSAGDYNMPMDMGMAGFNTLGMGMGLDTAMGYESQQFDNQNAGIDSASSLNPEWAQWGGWNMGAERDA